MWTLLLFLLPLLPIVGLILYHYSSDMTLEQVKAEVAKVEADIKAGETKAKSLLDK